MDVYANLLLDCERWCVYKKSKRAKFVQNKYNI